MDDCCIQSTHCTCIYNIPDGENLLDDCCIQSIHCTCIYNTPDGDNLLDDCCIQLIHCTCIYTRRKVLIGRLLYTSMKLILESVMTVGPDYVVSIFI